jgi:hypothetical protein
VELSANDGQLSAGQLSDGGAIGEEVTGDLRDSREVNVINSVRVDGNATLEDRA